MSQYVKGYRLERRVEQLYSQHGWLVTRFPKSGRGLYPADVLAVKRLGNKTLIHLIECKNLSKKEQKERSIYIEPEKIRKIIEVAQEHEASAFVVCSFPRRHPRILPAETLRSSGKSLSIRREDGISLKKFLSRLNRVQALQK
ncbi:MAG: restriction endonuclease [Candidatus Bathyarchaeia archaeon]